MSIRTELEAESLCRLREAVDLSGLPALSRAVAERVILTTGDVEWADDLVLDERALAAGAEALRAKRPLVVDVDLIAAGVPGAAARCGLRDERAARLAAKDGTPRSAEGLRLAARTAGPGAVYAVGSAPAALDAVLSLDAAPALVIGLPVGWVGAVEAKRALRASGLPSMSNRSRKGGSAAAAAVLHALRHADGLQHG